MLRKGRLSFALPLALLALLSLPALAESLELKIRSYPPNARLRDQFGNQLGRSGQTIRLDWSRSQGPLHLEVSKDGHRSLNRTLSYRELAVGVYPEEGELVLPPESLAVRIEDYLRYRTANVLGFTVFALLSLMLARRTWSSSTSSLEETDELVGEYRVLERVGRGATAEVFKAVSADDPAQLPVAVKFMLETESLDDQALDRFRQEIQTCLKLSHPNLFEIYNWGEHRDGRLYLVTELLEGKTLRQELRTSQRLEASQVAEILGTLSLALDYLHQEHLIHRDVKPDNVFRPLGAPLKLMDLGIAKNHEVNPLTKIGTAMGTPHYMAPEQAQGKPCFQSDQYSLAVLVFELLTGERPYKGTASLEIIQKHISAPIPRLSQYLDWVGPLLDDCLVKAMAKSPENRFESVLDFSQAFRSALAAQHGESPDTEAFDNTSLNS